MAHVAMPKRVFGKVDEYGGALAASTFLRIWRFPLVPTGSVWLTAGVDGMHAQKIRPHLRSIAAGYLRTWAPFIFWLSFAFDTVAMYCVAAAVVAFCIWSWTWRMAHRHMMQRRNDFDLVTLGTQCPPHLLRAEDLAALLEQQKANFAKLKSERSADDVARFGSANAAELLAAYGLLRVYGTATPLTASDARFAAMRIMNGSHDKPSSDAGVFRSTTEAATPVLAAGQLAEQVAVQAQRLRARKTLLAATAPKTFLQKVMWGGVHRLLGYLVLAVTMVGGIGGAVKVQDPDRFDFVSEQRLRNSFGAGKTEYRVQCDALTPYYSSGSDETLLCRVGKQILPVVTRDGQGVTGNVVRGRLRARHIATDDDAEASFRRDRHRRYRPAPWEKQLAADPQTDVQTFQVYLETHLLSVVGQVILALTCTLGALALLLVWERVRRQRNRVIADAKRVIS